MLFVFQATPVVNEPDDMVPAISEDGVFQVMPNLTKLYLNDCDFNQTHLTKLFASSSLNFLLMDNNKITSINETNIPIKINQMSLKGNPFLCNCDLVWFRKWVDSNPNRLLGWPDDYICNLPIPDG